MICQKSYRYKDMDATVMTQLTGETLGKVAIQGWGMA